MGPAHLPVDRCRMGCQRRVRILFPSATAADCDVPTWPRGQPAWCGVALAAVCAIAMSGLGVSGPLDVVNGNSFLPLLRAIAGFTIGLGIFRYSHRLDRLSMPVQDLLVGGLSLAIVV